MAETESVLLARYAQRRDADAFRALFDVHQHMVYAACHRVLGNPEDAEDAAQSCFFQLAVKAARLKAPIAGWLHKVAVNVSVDMLRQKSSRTAREAKVREAPSPSPDRAWDEIKGSVDEAIAALPDDLRVPVVLYYLEGKKQDEVADALGISQPAVSGRLERGVSALRKRLAKAGFVAGAVGPAALAAMLSANAAEAAPAALSAALGKMALAGVGAGAAGAVGATASAKVAVVVLLAVFGVVIIGGVSLIGVLLSRAGARALSERQPAASVVTVPPRGSAGSAAHPGGTAVPPEGRGSAAVSPAPAVTALGGEVRLNDDGGGSNMFLDLDTGRLFTIPTDVADVEPMVRWMRGQGADVLHSKMMELQSLIAADMSVAQVPGSAWKDATYEWLGQTLGAGPAGPAFPVFLKAKGVLPATFVFRTREGGMGVLQVLGFDEHGAQGARIRHRLVLP